MNYSYQFIVLIFICLVILLFSFLSFLNHMFSYIDIYIYICIYIYVCVLLYLNFITVILIFFVIVFSGSF